MMFIKDVLNGKLRARWALVVLLLLWGACAGAATYDIGPGQPYANLGDLSWLSLVAGDTVRIHWQATPYREKIGLRCRGSATAPIRITGVPGPAGELPELSGENASTSPEFSGFFSAQWDEFLGVILIKRASSDPWGYKPGHLIIENLRITGAHSDNTYTNTAGGVVHYADGAGAIWAVLAEHLTIRGCEITGNGNGLFVLSKGSEEEVSRTVLIEHNYLHHNGVVGSYLQHNIYTQVAGMVFQYNRIDKLRSGALGSALKDRSSGTIIRYNRIEASARLLDLVDPEDSAVVLTNEPDFHQTLVYGNLLINDTSEAPYSGNMIHYGGDSTRYGIYRKGTLYFYHNTVHIPSAQSDLWYLRLFDLSTNDEYLEISNNILYLNGTTEFNLMNLHGRASFTGTNWISSDWIPHRPGFDGSISGTHWLIEGDAPGFRDESALDLRLSRQSPCLDRATALSTNLVTHPVDSMYEPLARAVPRKVIDGGPDLGSLEQEGRLINIDIKRNAGELDVSYLSPTGRAVHLVASTNLVHWDAIGITTNVTETNQWVISPANATGYYRLTTAPQ